MAFPLLAFAAPEGLLRDPSGDFVQVLSGLTFGWLLNGDMLKGNCNKASLLFGLRCRDTNFLCHDPSVPWAGN